MGHGKSAHMYAGLQALWEHWVDLVPYSDLCPHPHSSILFFSFLHSSLLFFSPLILLLIADSYPLSQHPPISLNFFQLVCLLSHLPFAPHLFSCQLKHFYSHPSFTPSTPFPSLFFFFFTHFNSLSSIAHFLHPLSSFFHINSRSDK